jgi:hypothetical protein
MEFQLQRLHNIKCDEKIILMMGGYEFERREPWLISG